MPERRQLRPTKTKRPVKALRPVRAHFTRIGLVGERPRRPDEVVIEYTAAMSAIYRDLFAEYQSALPALFQPEDARADAVDPRLARRIRAAREAAERRHRARFTARTQDAIARRAVEEAEAFNEAEQARVVSSLGLDVPPVDIRAELADAADRNAAAIRNLSDRVLADVADLVEEAVFYDRPREWVIERLQARHGVAESRAALIANIEIRRLNGELARIRQQAAGLTRYEWGPTESQQPRALHNRYRTRIFDWNDPPEGGHPGNLPQCKCVAIPVR